LVAGGIALAIVACLGGAYLVRGVAGGLLGPSATITAVPDPVAIEAPTPVAAIILPTAPSSPTASAPTASTPSGVATLRDSSLQLSIADVPAPPSGFQYSAWLIAADGSSLNLGSQTPVGSALTLSYVDPGGLNLASHFTTVAISLEPVPDPSPAIAGQIVYRAEVPTDLASQLQSLEAIAAGAPLTETLASGAVGQAKTFDSHKGFSVSDVSSGNLVGARQHAEHTINIAVGNASPDYGDWDSNGNIQNPGDGFGLLNYLQLWQALAQHEAASPLASAGRKASLTAFADQVGAARDSVQNAVELAKRLASSDTAEEMGPLAAEWDAISAEGSVAALGAQADGLSINVWLDVFRLE
jgi:hypothetical protein